MNTQYLERNNNQKTDSTFTAIGAAISAVKVKLMLAEQWRCTHSKCDRGQQQNYRVNQTFAVDCHLNKSVITSYLCSYFICGYSFVELYCYRLFVFVHFDSVMLIQFIFIRFLAYHWSVADYKSSQCPGEAQSQQHIKDVTADGVGDSHVSHTYTYHIQKDKRYVKEMLSCFNKAHRD